MSRFFDCAAAPFFGFSDAFLSDVNAQTPQTPRSRGRTVSKCHDPFGQRVSPALGP